VTIKNHKTNINDHIDGLTDKVESLFEHQKAELEREYQSKVTKTHAEIENKFNAKQDNAASLQKQEDEYRRKLELITSIAQRIDNENRQLRKENRELKSEYKA